MAKSSIALLVILFSLMSACGGFIFGKDVQLKSDEAKYNSETVERLTTLITVTDELVVEANNASIGMREALSGRVKQDNLTTRDLENALAKTFNSRTNCSFDDDSMQQLTAARDRAAQAVAAGVRDKVP